jgi:hypothetical protein
MHEIYECVPRHQRLVAEPQGFAVHAVEHPGWNLAVGCAIILVELAPKHGPALAHHLHPHDNLSVVERVPPIVDAPHVRLLGILDAGCTTSSADIRPSATLRRPSSRGQYGCSESRSQLVCGIGSSPVDLDDLTSCARREGFGGADPRRHGQAFGYRLTSASPPMMHTVAPATQVPC